MTYDFTKDSESSPDEQIERNEAVREFVKKLRENSFEELDAIITRYIGYKPETVEAALIVAVDKGFLGYDLKNELLDQINSNFKIHANGIKVRKWESDNVFTKYVSIYDDEKIYNIIEDTRGIVIDVYHAVLITAKQRELISVNDFERFYSEAITASLSDREIENQEVEKFLNELEETGPVLTNEQLEEEAGKYWKCPKCGEMVDMELAVCWNCEAETPETVEHPGIEEVRKNLSVKKPFGFSKTGFILIICGILTFINGFDTFSFHHHTHYGRFVFGGFFILVGLFFVGYGIIGKGDD
jgi:rubrerythrin